MYSAPTFNVNRALIVKQYKLSVDGTEVYTYRCINEWHLELLRYWKLAACFKQEKELILICLINA